MGTVRGMDTQSTSINDLYALILVDGLPTESGGKILRYRTVRLRETNVADERIAARLAERVVMVGGVHKLLVSDAEFRYAMTMRHCEKFVCDQSALPLALMDLELFGKLSPHDLQLIEERVVLITLAAQVRYGVISQAEFDLYAAGQEVPGKPDQQSPQRVGQAANMGEHLAVSQPGPALLADYAGDAAQGAAPGHGA
jgi:phage FluMu protein gp41